MEQFEIATERSDVEEESNTCGTLAKTAIIVMGILTLVGIVVSAIIVIFLTDMIRSPKSELLFVQVIFNPGAHAPDGLDDEALFPRGPGQLTDRGFANSYRLGEFLHEQYVKTKFLDPLVRSKQMSWLSTKSDKCLTTASTVSAGMFNSEESMKYAPVVAADRLVLEDSSRCSNLMHRNCSSSPTNDLKKCLNLQNVLFNKYNLSTILEFVEKHRNGINVPREIHDRLDQVIDIHYRINNYRLGLGEYRNSALIRLQFGPILHKIVSKFNQEKKPKFIAYSVDDALFTGLVEIFNQNAQKLPKTVGFNSMILMEMRKFGVNDTRIDIRYKAEEESSKTLLQLTPEGFRIADLIEKTRILVDEHGSAGCND